jgi:hypothetical protein
VLKLDPLRLRASRSLSSPSTRAVWRELAVYMREVQIVRHQEHGSGGVRIDRQ